MAIREFLGWLIANTILDFRNWPIQDGRSKTVDWIIGNIELNWVELSTWVFPGSMIENTISDFRGWPIQDGGSKMADPSWRIQDGGLETQNYFQNLLSNSQSVTAKTNSISTSS